MVSAAVIDVGPGQAVATPEAALAQARAGDTIRIHATPQGYEKVALLVRVPKLTIVGVVDKPATTQPKEGLANLVTLNGAGFDYSGAGRVPRAIIQFDPDASGGVVEGFELVGAHNTSNNGAGVRINAANNITIRNCTIRDCDMGIMSNGELAKQTGANQLIVNCVIHHNGTEREAGYNHNLYLGGTSVTVRGCHIYNALTGHNLKSRAHQTWVEACYIHDSPNRELDLVDAKGNTDAEASDAVVFDCIIKKAPGMTGNKTVLHFGQDGGGAHNGTLYLLHTTILTAYASPIVDLSAAGAQVKLLNSIVVDFTGGSWRGNKQLVNYRSGAKPDSTDIQGNILAHGFVASGENHILAPEAKVQFGGAGAYSFAVMLRSLPTVKLVDLTKLALPAAPEGKVEPGHNVFVLPAGTKAREPLVGGGTALPEK
jgi:hypothetical protein